jgi:uncharacterized protein YdhG (YjbR/CyaY superfamily)
MNKKMKVCSRGHKYTTNGPCPVCWPSGAVDAYIARAPKEAHLKLKEMRKAIQAVAPKAVEGISYRMPSYDGVCRSLSAATHHCGA